MAMRVCLDCPKLTTKSRCPECARAKDRARGSAAARGYGKDHQDLRAELLPKAIGQPCHFCGEPMLEGQPLALDHTEDRNGYRGMAHLSCNAADGGRRSHN